MNSDFGGGEGSRTPVRKHLRKNFSGCIILFGFNALQEQDTNLAEHEFLYIIRLENVAL